MSYNLPYISNTTIDSLALSGLSSSLCLNSDKVVIIDTLPTNLYTSLSTINYAIHDSNYFSTPFQFSTLTSKKSGRLPGLYTCDIIQYKNENFAIITIQHKKNDIKFVVDYSLLECVMHKVWHLSSGKYIATNFHQADGSIKEVYLHNYLKYGTLENDKTHIIHINHNPLDNRLENLRAVDPAQYHQSKSKRKRTIVLPVDCGFLSDDIPTYISYMKANGEHGDRFAIEIPRLNIFKKLSSSKKIPLKDKLEEAKNLLTEIYNENPDINPNKEAFLIQSLTNSFNAILSLESS